MTLHNLCIDQSVPQEIRPPKQSRNPSHSHHINNNGGPSSLLTDLFHRQQMKDLEMNRPALVIERQRAQRAQDQRNF